MSMLIIENVAPKSMFITFWQVSVCVKHSHVLYPLTVIYKEKDIESIGMKKIYQNCYKIQQPFLKGI